MSKHNRTPRRRRIALGLGATGGGLLAAAFIPLGVATAVVGDPGVAPIDTETTPDPFSDFTGVSDLQADGVTPNAEGLLDNQLNLDNSALGAQIDYDIDNNEPFSFGSLDGFQSMPAGWTGEGTTANPTDLDPFEDAFLNNNNGSELGTLSTGETWADAQSYDYALNQGLTVPEVNTLDGMADGTITSVVPPTLVPDNDPAADFVQIFDPNAFTTNAIGVEAPNDFLGQLAVFDDSFLQAFGVAGPLDQFVDAFTGGFTGAGLDGLFGTGTDAFTNGALDGLTSIF
jgi:hypothetical protein